MPLDAQALHKLVQFCFEPKSPGSTRRGTDFPLKWAKARSISFQMINSLEPETQVAVFRAICKYRPRGIAAHFNMINIVLDINRTMGTAYSANDIWGFVNELYNLEFDEELVQKDFELPIPEFEHEIEQIRRSEIASEGTPDKEEPKRQRLSGRVKKRKV